MSPSVQLSFALRTSSNVRSVHLIGSWDNYTRQLPLSAVTKPGKWSGTFRFQGSQALQLGSRYWYYYIVDGYHVSHDPAKEFVTEKTTGRKLNVLDIPSGNKTKTATTTKAATKASLSVQTQNLSSTRSRRESAEVAHGRALSPTRIQCPKPQKPYASRGLREADYEVSPIDDLEARFAGASLASRSPYYPSSPALSDVSDASSGDFSAPSSPASSCSSVGPTCRCERYGMTRDGRRVKLDCGGRRCGYDSADDSCSEDESEQEKIAIARWGVRAQAARASPRQAMIVTRRP